WGNAFGTVIIAPCNTAVSCQMTVYTKILTPSNCPQTLWITVVNPCLTVNDIYGLLYCLNCGRDCQVCSTALPTLSISTENQSAFVVITDTT
ncbi:hypothetical protein, partial [Sulfuricella sp. T08]|uniref:hypothetical protein n=1 Tax=Sulfuricella sp. T08 TaxID=1632857 RepID=UPI001ED99BC0